MPSPSTLVGETLKARYRLSSEIGSGGMGVVYRARDLELQREVAVKVLGQAALDSDGRERLLREARAAAALNHSHIVSVYDVGEDNGVPFVVMELIDGTSLRGLEPQPFSEIANVARQLCLALHHAHEHGIVHRDLKPENILVARGDDGPTVKLADLGLAFSSRATRLTSEGAIVGTASYLAPEQALGQEPDARVDLYALGVVLYELVARRLPFTGDDPLAVVSQHLYAPVVPPRAFRPDVPPPLEAMILRLMAKDPALRFDSARAVLDALDELPGLEGPAAPPAAPVTDRVALLEQLVRGRLVGRAAELQQLRELWRRAQQGQGHLALISGEPGAGKTRLACEVTVYAQLNGAVILRGGCYEYEATTPYLPLVEALRGWVHAQPVESLREAVGPTASELVKLAPEIETRLGPLPPSPALSPNEERLRLFDHVARFVQGLAAGRGVLLFIDDLQWADQGTLTLLQYLLRNLRGERLLVLGTYREVELDRAHPLAAALVEWNRERLATRIQLGRLPLPDTATLLATLLSQDTVTPEFTEAVFRETEGNPFFVEEVLKSLIEQGQIYREGGEWHRGEVHDLAIPQSVKAAIGRRLDRLGGACTETLHTAAAMGKDFTFRELMAVTSHSEDEVLDALDEAATAQLVAGRSGEDFTFTHDKIREVLYEELNPIRRKRLHLRIGAGLEKLHARDVETRAQDLAHHFLEAGDLEKGMDYSMIAARNASRVFAHREALDFYRRAHECAEALERVDRLAEIEEAIAEVHFDEGEAAVAAEHYQRALALTSNPDKRAALQTLIGRAYGNIGDARGLQFLNAAIEVLDPDRQPIEMARALLMIGRYHHYAGRMSLAVEYLERARRLAEPLGDPDTLSFLYPFLAGAYQHLANFEESMRWARQNITLGERENLPVAIAVGHEFFAEDLTNLGRWHEVIEHGTTDREIGERIGSLDRVGWAEYALGMGHHGLGDLAAAAASARHGLELAERIGEKRLTVLVRAVLSMVQADLGFDDDARANAERAVADGDALTQVAMRSESRCALAYVSLRMGLSAEALRVSRELVELRGATENRLGLQLYPLLHAEAALREGEVEEAIERVGVAEEVAGLIESRHYLAVAERLRGQIHAAGNEDERALQAFGSAIEALKRNESRLEHGRALLLRAQLHRKLNRPDAARADAARARELFDRCGAIRDAARARALAG